MCFNETARKNWRLKKSNEIKMQATVRQWKQLLRNKCKEDEKKKFN